MFRAVSAGQECETCPLRRGTRPRVGKTPNFLRATASSRRAGRFPGCAARPVGAGRQVPCSAPSRSRRPVRSIHTRWTAGARAAVCPWRWVAWWPVGSWAEAMGETCVACARAGWTVLALYGPGSAAALQRATLAAWWRPGSARPAADEPPPPRRGDGAPRGERLPAGDAWRPRRDARRARASSRRPWCWAWQLARGPRPVSRHADHVRPGWSPGRQRSRRRSGPPRPRPSASSRTPPSAPRDPRLPQHASRRFQVRAHSTRHRAKWRAGSRAGSGRSERAGGGPRPGTPNSPRRFRGGA